MNDERIKPATDGGERPLNPLQRILNAKLIFEGRSKEVFGWTVRSPYYSACNQLDEAFAELAGAQDEKSKKLAAMAHELYGDMARGAAIRGPVIVARQQYKQALAIFEETLDIDGALRVRDKLHSLEDK